MTSGKKFYPRDTDLKRGGSEFAVRESVNAVKNLLESDRDYRGEKEANGRKEIERGGEEVCIDSGRKRRGSARGRGVTAGR